MKNIILYILFLPLSGWCQNSDWKELQGMIDKAIQQNGSVRLKRNYSIDKPLVAAKWENNRYEYFSIEILGEATMWDVNQKSVIKTSFTDAPALSIQKGRNILIQGVNFQGRYSAPKLSIPEMYGTDLENYKVQNARDSRYSPHSAIAIDPFSTDIPKDGGYFSMKEFYRGSRDNNGSHLIRIEDCTFNGFVIGAVISPNGYTKEGDSIQFKNIRIGTTKIGIAAGNTNLKMNSIVNIGAWGDTHTLFDFSHYGNQAGGNWSINGVNLAGNVVRLVDRKTPMNTSLKIKNVFAESLGTIGFWSGTNDSLEFASINFRYINQTKGFPDYAFNGTNVTIRYSTLRYYGEKLPILFIGNNKYLNNIYDGNSPVFLDNSILTSARLSFELNRTKDRVVSFSKSNVKENDILLLYSPKLQFLGYGIVRKSSSGDLILTDESPSVKKAGKYIAIVAKK